MNRGLDVRRHIFAQARERPGLRRHDLGDYRLRRRPRVRRHARQHLVRDTAQGVDVGTTVELPLARGLFRAHVVRRAHGNPALRQAVTPGGGEREGDPEIGQQRLTVLQQHVLRLQVPMNHSLPVRVIEGLSQRLRERDGVLHRQLPLSVQQHAERFAGDVGHHIVEQAFRRTGVVQRQDVRMLEMRGEFDLLQEPLGTDDRRDFRADDLDRDLAVMFQVPREVHGGHAASPELPLQAVAIGQAGAETVERCDHSTAMLGAEDLPRKEALRQPVVLLADVTSREIFSPG